MVTAMPNLGQMSPEEKQAYLEYLKGLATQQKTSADASNQAQGQMDMARSGDVGLEFGNQAGAIIQSMLGQQGSAQMFAQKANQAPLSGMAQQDTERFAQHLKDQARLGDSMGQAKIHMGARQTDLTQKAELSEQERQQVLMKMIVDAQEKKADRVFRADEGDANRANAVRVAQMHAAAAASARAQAREFRNEDKATAEATRGAAAAEKNALKAKEKTDEQTKDLAKIVGTDATDAVAMLGEISTRIGGVESRKKDLPGVGSLEGLAPNWLTSEKGKGLRDSLKRLTNALLKIQSGAGVSESERAEAQALHGLNGATETQLYDAIARAKVLSASALRQKMSGFTPDAVRQYRANGGVVPSDIMIVGRDKVNVRRISDGTIKPMAPSDAMTMDPIDYEVVP